MCLALLDFEIFSQSKLKFFSFQSGWMVWVNKQQSQTHYFSIDFKALAGSLIFNVDLASCRWPELCLKINHHLSLRSLALGRRFTSRLCLHLLFPFPIQNNYPHPVGDVMAILHGEMLVDMWWDVNSSAIHFVMSEEFSFYFMRIKCLLLNAPYSFMCILLSGKLSLFL